MNFEVYAYWNIVELKGVFNAVAALTGSANFTGLLRTIVLVGLLSLVMVVLAGRGKMEDFWKWIIMVAIFNGMLLVPKSNVLLVDRTGTQPTQVVANVPIGLALFAHSISKVGDFLTRSYETTFSLPNDLKFQTNGMMFGQRVQREIRSMTPATAAWRGDFIEFWRECVIPELYAGGQVNLDNLARENDAFAYLSGKTNPALFVTLSTVGMTTCPSAHVDLNNRLNTWEAPARLGNLARQSFPGDATANARLSSLIVSGDSHFTNLSQSAVAAVRQGIVGNMIIDAECAVQAQAGNTAQSAACLAAAQGMRASNHTYKTLAMVAESSMPKLRSAIEIIQYAVFPLILLIVIAAGHHGMIILKTYVASLMWVQLWPPLYAVVHYIMTIKAQSWAAATEGIGGSMIYQEWIRNASMSDEAIAGMLVVAIPPIAAALVKGGEVGLQAVAGMTSPRMAERAAMDSAMGNLSMGKVEAAPTTRIGAPTATLVGAGGVNTATFADGTQAIDASGLSHKGSLAVNTAGRISAAAQLQSEQSETAAIGQATNAVTTTSAGIQNAIDFAKTRAKNERAGVGYGSGDQTSFTKAANRVEQITDTAAKELGLTQTQAAQVLAAAGVSAGTPKLFNAVSPVSLDALAEVTDTSSAGASQTLKKLQNYAKTIGFSDAVDEVRRTSKEATFATGDESGRQASERISANLDRSQQYAEQATASHQRSLALKAVVASARENSGAWNTGSLHPFVNWMKTQKNDQDWGRPFSPEAVMQMGEKNPELLTPFLDRFVATHIEPNLSAGVGNVKTHDDVRNFYDRNKPANEVAAKGAENIATVLDKAAKNGVRPGDKVTSDLPSQVAAEKAKGQAKIAKGQSEVRTEGQPLEKEAGKRTDPGSQALLGLAATNAVGQILPDGASKAMMSKLPGVNMTTGTSGAAVAEASAARAEAGQPRNPVMQSAAETNKAIRRGTGAMLPPAADNALEGALGDAGMPGDKPSGNPQSAQTDPQPAITGTPGAAVAEASAARAEAGQPRNPGTRQSAEGVGSERPGVVQTATPAPEAGQPASPAQGARPEQGPSAGAPPSSTDVEQLRAELAAMQRAIDQQPPAVKSNISELLGRGNQPQVQQQPQGDIQRGSEEASPPPRK